MCACVRVSVWHKYSSKVNNETENYTLWQVGFFLFFFEFKLPPFLFLPSRAWLLKWKGESFNNTKKNKKKTVSSGSSNNNKKREKKKRIVCVCVAYTVGDFILWSFNAVPHLSPSRILLTCPLLPLLRSFETCIAIHVVVPFFSPLSLSQWHVWSHNEVRRKKNEPLLSLLVNVRFRKQRIRQRSFLKRMRRREKRKMAAHAAPLGALSGHDRQIGCSSNALFWPGELLYISSFLSFFF